MRLRPRNGELGAAARSRRRRALAFTLVEMLIASSLGLLVVMGAMAFLWFAGLGISGVTAQARCCQMAGNTLEFINYRARLAVCASNDASGNVLTLGFDDDPKNDSDGDGIAYNDATHFERFQFVGLNGSGVVSSTNQVVYIPNITNAQRRILISGGARNLPACNIFSVTNKSTILIRFGIVDGYGGDRYQSVEIQGTAVPLNRPVVTNFIAIIP